MCSHDMNRGVAVHRVEVPQYVCPMPDLKPCSTCVKYHECLEAGWAELTRWIDAEGIE
jgi:hypothetical protein